MISVRHEKNYHEYEIEHPIGFTIITDDINKILSRKDEIIKLVQKEKINNNNPIIDYFEDTPTIIKNEKSDTDSAQSVKTIIGEHNGEIKYYDIFDKYAFEAPGISIYFTDIEELNNAVNSIDKFFEELSPEFIVSSIEYDDGQFEITIEHNGINYIFYELPTNEKIGKQISMRISQLKEIGEVTVYPNGEVQVSNDKITIRSKIDEFPEKHAIIMKLITHPDVLESFYDTGTFGIETKDVLIYWGEDCGMVFEPQDSEKIKKILNDLYDEGFISDDCYNQLIYDVEKSIQFIETQ